MTRSLDEIKEKVEINKNVISKLQTQNDSLKKALKTNVVSPFVSNPKNEEDSIIFITQQYLSASSWQKRKSHILSPDKNSAQMKDYYSSSYKPRKVEKEKIVIQGKNFKVGDEFTVFVGKRTEYYFVKTKQGYKIDWLASVGYNEMSMKTFKVSMSKTPTKFRVIAEISNYYNYNYINAQNSHWSIKVDDGRNSRLSCFVSKTSKTGKEIYEILKDGKKHIIIVELKSDNRDDKSGNIAVITKLIKSNWRTN